MKFRVSKKATAPSLLLSLSFLSPSSFAATTLMAGGHAGVVGQYTFGAPPLNSTYNAVRVPVGLTLTASPSDNLNLYLGLDYAYNNYPAVPTLLGQTSSNSTHNPNNQLTPMPFANSVNGNIPYGQKIDGVMLTTAYFTYQTPVGLLKAGRMPRHWGLGVWNDDQWSPTAGAISTTDAIALSTDLSLFDATAYYERAGESIGGTANDSNAIAYTLEVRLKTDPADIPSTGVNREIGVAYSKFDHAQSNTSLSILDIYGKFYLSQFFIGTEILYPSGRTQNQNYQALGGGPACTLPLSPATAQSISCGSQDVSSLAALVKLKLQLVGSETSSLAATETAQQLMGTAQREPSHVVGLWAGYVSGGSNQFDAVDSTKSGNSINAIMMHSNIQPSFLMFNNAMPPVNGMPTGAITNTTFARLDYTYESPVFGSIGPVLAWGKLNRLNANFNSNNGVCSGAVAVDPNSAVNRVCVGGSSNLGVEVDGSYRYTTHDRVQFGVDLGYWAVGSAWQVYGQGSPNATYGFRLMTGTEF